MLEYEPIELVDLPSLRCTLITVRSHWIRWGVRLLAIAMGVVAVVLVTTIPHQGSASCLVTPWSYWGEPHPYLGSVITIGRAPQINRPWECRFVMANRWHAAWGLGLGGVLLLGLSFLPRRKLWATNSSPDPMNRPYWPSAQ